MKRNSITVLAFFSLVASFGAIPLVRAQMLMVEPKRIVLDEKHRAGIANLYNDGDDTVSYSIRWDHLRMKEDGHYLEIDSLTPLDMIADSMVRYYPPEVTLPPHSAQVVRLRFLKPKDLAKAEYRSHLLFAQIDRGEPVEWKMHDTTSHELKVRLRPLWGVSIPVVVRNQTTPPVVSLDSVAISAMDSTRSIIFTANIYRSGVESSYGTVVIKYVNSSGVERQIGAFKNVGVYPPLQTRRLRLPLKIPEDVALKDGKISVEYQTAGEDPMPHIQASAQLALGK